MTFSSSRSLTSRTVGLAIAGVAAAALLGVFAQGRRSDAAPPPQSAAESAVGLAVEPLEVRLEPGYAVRERYVGRAVSRRRSSLGFTQSGLLEEVRVDEGDAVDAGQVLARLDAAGLRASRRELAAQLEEIEARLALARLTLERTRTLVGKDSVSTQRFDEARFEEMALSARLVSARAAIERVDVDLGHAELRAPFAGHIVARSADEGTILAPGQAVVSLIERGPMEARFGVPPEVAAYLLPGARYTIELDGGSAQAELIAVLDEVAADTRTVTAILLLEQTEPAIRHGELVRLSLETRRESPGFWIPIAALTESRRGLWAALALVPEPDRPGWHRVERRELSMLHADSDRAFVRGTLRDGERLAASGVHRLVPGQVVRLASDSPPRVGAAQ